VDSSPREDVFSRSCPVVGSLQRRPRMSPVRYAALALIAACTPVAYAPPSRLISLDSPTAPRAGGTDVQAEVGRLGSIFGPDLVDGNLRTRYAIDDGLAVEGEAGVARVMNEGNVYTETPSGNLRTQDATRTGYTARAGIIRHGRDGSVRGAVTAGLGGGYAPIAGGWASADVGASVGGTNHWVRPWFAGDLAYNQPVSSRRFAVSNDDSETTLEMAANGMVRLTIGLELGPENCALLLGFSVTTVLASSNGVLDNEPHDGNEGFLTLAAGFRAQL
jgi:hypothetical protein